MDRSLDAIRAHANERHAHLVARLDSIESKIQPLLDDVQRRQGRRELYAAVSKITGWVLALASIVALIGKGIFYGT